MRRCASASRCSNCELSSKPRWRRPRACVLTKQSLRTRVRPSRIESYRALHDGGFDRPHAHAWRELCLLRRDQHSAGARNVALAALNRPRGCRGAEFEWQCVSVSALIHVSRVHSVACSTVTRKLCRPMSNVETRMLAGHDVRKRKADTAMLPDVDCMRVSLYRIQRISQSSHLTQHGGRVAACRVTGQQPGVRNDRKLTPRQAYPRYMLQAAANK